MKRHGTVLAVGISLLALLAAACSDVEEEPEAGGGGGTAPNTANVAQCGEDTIVLGGEPVDRREGERGRRAGPDGTADGLHRRAGRPDRREGAVPRDG